MRTVSENASVAIAKNTPRMRKVGKAMHTASSMLSAAPASMPSQGLMPA